MERERLRAAGALGNAPLLALSSLSPRTFPCARNNRVMMHEHFLVAAQIFQTCRIADPLNRPGVKRRSRWVWKPVLAQARQ
jgi:hypothetical protein